MDEVTKEFINKIKQQLEAGNLPMDMVSAFNQYTNAIYSVHCIEIGRRELALNEKK